MRKHLTRSLIAASSAAAVTLGCAVSASAVSVTAPSSSVTLLSTTDQQAALDYWTPERMAAATTVDRVVDEATGLVQEATAAAGAAASELSASAGSPAGPLGADRSTLAAGEAPVVARDPRSVSDLVTGDAVSTGTRWTGGTVGTVGRLYFQQGGRDYECTASSVDSPQGNVIVTAGHCLTENGVDSTSLVFVPGLAGTEEPFGRFAVSVDASTRKPLTYTTEQWRTGDQSSAAALNYDAGFARVSTRDGRTLEQTVGSFDIEFSGALSRVTVFGYPGRGTNSDGHTLQYCTGWQFTDAATGDATTDRATLCSMAGGSSGGPWVRGFDGADDSGTVTSVVSFSYNNAPEVLYGPEFGDVIEAVYARATS